MGEGRISIRLLDQRTLGRGFQLASLGAVYEFIRDSEIKGAIRDSVASGELRLSVSGLTELGENLAKFLQQSVCKEKKEKEKNLLPSLYTSGVNDYKILAGLGMVSPDDNRLDCDHLISYSRDIVSRGVGKSSLIPMLFRAYVFSEYRDQRGGGRDTAEAPSIWLGITGAIISLAGVINIDRDRYELYIVPDGSLPSVNASSKLYSLMHSDKVRHKLWHALRNIYRPDTRLGISPELSILLSILIHAVEEEDLAVRLSQNHEYESFMLTRISVEKRPQVMWNSVLSLSRYISELKKREALYVVSNLYNMISDLRSLGPEERGDAEVSLVTCVYELFRFLETQDPSSLTACSSNLSRTYLRLAERQPRYADHVRWLLKYLERLAV